MVEVGRDKIKVAETGESGRDRGRWCSTFLKTNTGNSYNIKFIHIKCGMLYICIYTCYIYIKRKRRDPKLIIPDG